MTNSINLIKHNIKQIVLFLVLLSISFLTPLSTFAQSSVPNVLLDVTTSRLDASQTQLVFKLKTPWSASVPSFLLANPARLVLDLPNTTNEFLKSNISFDIFNEQRAVFLAQSGGKTRAVINLNRNLPYKINTQGNNIIVVFTLPNNTSTVLPVVQPALIQPAINTVNLNKNVPTSSSREVKSIDFRRSEDGAARLIVDLSDGSSAMNVRLQGSFLVLDIDSTTLPDRLRRKLDVVDFATPVQRITSIMDGSTTRITLDPKGVFDYSAYQADNRIVVEVRAVKEDPNKLVQGVKFGYKGDKLSLNFQNIEVRNLLQVFADFTNLNIVTSDTVQGTITLRLKDVPWDQALDIVMQSKSLDSRKNGNVVLIAPREELLAKEKLELERVSQLAILEPLRSEVFQLQYQKAEDIKKMLNESNGSSTSGNQQITTRFLSQRGSVSADTRTNQVFVTDVSGKLDEVKKLLSKIDIPIRQVMIEARIVEADDRFGRNLGVKLGFNDAKSTQYRTINGVKVPIYGAGSNILGTGLYGTVSGNQQGAIDLSAQTTDSSGSALGLATQANVANSNFINLPAGGLGGVNPASIALSLFGSGLTRFINLEISALEADNKGKVISSPRVVTSDSMKATIESGTEIPYVVTSRDGTTTTFKKAVLKLEVTPQITPEGNVIMDVEVNKDTRGENTGASGFAIDTKQIKTQVLVENGGTVVIGGVYTQEESTQTTKVPLLGDLPFVGNLFRSNQKVNNRSELLIFLTPRVILNNNLIDANKNQ
jgi:type IV pilus assembly protein PilQ